MRGHEPLSKVRTILCGVNDAFTGRQAADSFVPIIPDRLRDVVSPRQLPCVNPQSLGFYLEGSATKGLSSPGRSRMALGQDQSAGFVDFDGHAISI
jgi:hypothetical protein